MAAEFECNSRLAGALLEGMLGCSWSAGFPGRRDTTGPGLAAVPDI